MASDRITDFINNMLDMPEDFFNEARKTLVKNNKGKEIPVMNTGMYNAIGEINNGVKFNDLSDYYKKQFTKNSISRVKNFINKTNYTAIPKEELEYYDAWKNAAETHKWKQHINNDSSFVELPTGNQPISGYEELGDQMLKQNRIDKVMSAQANASVAQAQINNNNKIKEHISQITAQGQESTIDSIVHPNRGQAEAEAKKTLAEWDKRDRQQEEARQAELDNVNNKKLGVTSLERNEVKHNALYEQFRDHYNKDGTRKISAVAERDFAGHFDKDLSLTDFHKKQLLDKRWEKTLHEFDKRRTRESQKMALEKFSKDYGLDVDLSNYKTSTLGRIANRIKGNKNIPRSEAMARVVDAYMKKTDEYVNDLKEQRKSGKITDRQYLNRANIGWNRVAARQERKALESESKNFRELGWKGKGLAAVGLIALGGVISNMFSGGKKSNAELYNPNPQPQYYS